MQLMGAIFFVLPYVSDFRGKFMLASAGLMGCLFYLYRQKTWDVAGLRAPKKQFLFAIFLLIGLALASSWFIQYVADQAHLSVEPFQAWDWRVSPVFQVFNEEIVTRALLLGFLMKWFRWKWATAFLAAAAFSGLHYLLYTHYLKGAVILSPWTLANLFLFGLLCNFLFLQWRHIWFGYAVHLGWNLTRFTRDFVHNGNYVSEGTTFNIFEGQKALTVALVLVLCGLLMATRKPSDPEAA